MNSKLKKAFSIGILAIILFFFFLYISRNIDDFKQLKLVKPSLIILLAVITLLSSTFNGMITDRLVSSFNIKLKFKEWFGLSIITTFYNTITPFRGGMVARAFYLKKRHNFPYTTFLAALAGTYVITFFIASLFGIISLIGLYLLQGIFNYWVLAIYLAFFIPLLIIILISPKFTETKNNFINKFIEVLNGWYLIHKNRKTILAVGLISIIQLLIGASGYIISYSMFEIQVSLVQAIFLSTFGSFAILISITPAGLGISEAVSVFSALVIGITPVQSLTVAILNRAVSTIILFILGPIFSYLLFKNQKTNKNKTE
jgi:uncharacterized protein (TIRG00374 family)